MDIDPRHVDEVLATTRAVRRRLDLQRPVDNQLLLDCIDLAEQAPTGGNLGSRRWVIVREQAVKDQLGELYRETALPFMSTAAERLRGTGHPQEQVMASAQYLAEHLAEVPAIVIPTIVGRHGGDGRPGLFDSVIQAAWSFCLALRARGLGTTWVTAALQDEGRVKEILGIPAHMTEVVLLPVAWTKGTEFRRATRHPAHAITYFDRFGTTSERGPGESLRFEDGPGAIAEIDIDAAAAVVWSLVTDVNLPTRFSDESIGAEWQGDERGVGAVFIGRNRHKAVGEWALPCIVDACERTDRLRLAHLRSRQPGCKVVVRSRTGRRPHPVAVQLRHRVRARRAPPWRSPRTRARRTASCGAASTSSQANMQRTLEGIKQLAEESP